MKPRGELVLTKRRRRSVQWFSRACCSAHPLAVLKARGSCDDGLGRAVGRTSEHDSDHGQNPSLRPRCPEDPLDDRIERSWNPSTSDSAARARNRSQSEVLHLGREESQLAYAIH